MTSSLRFYGFALLMLLSWTSVQAQYTFRNTNWNMTKAQVMASEKQRPTTIESDLIHYENISLGSYSTSLTYVFSKIGLVEAVYTLNAKHIGNVGHYNDYSALKDKLTTKYGEPENLDRWYKSLYKDEKENYGDAVALEHVTFASRWRVGVTDVILMLHGKNGECQNGIVYSYNLAPKADPKEELKDF